MEIHYFQRYHSKENVDTANAMLLLSRLYQSSADKFYSFLRTHILPDNFDPELVFRLQERSENSVPDAVISQESFKIVVETKLHGNFGLNQLVNHLKDFGTADCKILLTLDPALLEGAFKSDIDLAVAKYNQENGTNVVHKHLTFKGLCDAVRTVIDDDDELQDVIDDYEEYCNSSDLIPNDQQKMRMMLAGATIEFNKVHGVYYDRVNRGFSRHAYLGLYNQKSVRAIGKIKAIVAADRIDGQIEHKTEKGTWEPGMEAIINAAMNDAVNYGYNIERGHRFFFVDKFYDTDFPKTTLYPPRGCRMFNLADILGCDKLPQPEQIAELLRGKSWK